MRRTPQKQRKNSNLPENFPARYLEISSTKHQAPIQQTCELIPAKRNMPSQTGMILNTVHSSSAEFIWVMITTLQRSSARSFYYHMKETPGLMLPGNVPSSLRQQTSAGKIY